MDNHHFSLLVFRHQQLHTIFELLMIYATWKTCSIMGFSRFGKFLGQWDSIYLHVLGKTHSDKTTNTAVL